jgi:hypothetical protein
VGAFHVVVVLLVNVTMQSLPDWVTVTPVVLPTSWTQIPLPIAAASERGNICGAAIGAAVNKPATKSALIHRLMRIDGGDLRLNMAPALKKYY